MDMVRKFNEIQVHRNGTVISTDQNENFKIFSSHYEKINGNDIFKYVYNMKLFQNVDRYLVNYVDFKPLSGESSDYFFCSFRMMLREVFMHYEYLLLSTFINEERKNEFNSYYYQNKILNAL